jgi:hypothetical protein
MSDLITTACGAARWRRTLRASSFPSPVERHDSPKHDRASSANSLGLFDPYSVEYLNDDRFDLRPTHGPAPD